MFHISKNVGIKGYTYSTIGVANLIKSLQDFINANVIGWECVTCNVCNRNADYEHGPEYPECPIGMAIALRCKIENRHFRVVSGNGYKVLKHRRLRKVARS